MVEFGLKLEDNKVSEWADYYIDYETLKKLLDKLNSAVKYRDELEIKSPTLASKLRNEFLATTGKKKAFSRPSSPVEEEFGGVDNELTTLIDKKEKNYHTDGYESPKEDKLRKSSSGGSISPTFFHRTYSFAQRRYESKYEEALASVETSLENFSKCLYGEVDKVNNFYHKKVEELQTQLLLLIESAENNLEPHQKNHHQTDSATAASSLLKNVSHFVSQKVLQIELAHANEDEEEEVNSHGKGNVDERIVRVSESIKRALAELYRTSKLLSNFAHLNSTGFIKIIKKFKKNYPEEKARFEHIVKNKVLSEAQEG